ncbi:MAG: glycosyltransferase family 2 protein [Chloroflexi bacterium]|nr:glycosyltransferase family 2 protein [Chloroflexota bacterium]
MTEPVDLTLVLACYNEEPIIERSVREIVDILDMARFRYEIIFVDDCSRDRTRELIDHIIAAYPDHRMSRIFHEHNVGRGGTVADGIRASQAEFAGFIDIDLEVHARYIPSCVLALQQGADVVTGLRNYKFSLRRMDRYFMSRGYAWLMRTLLEVPIQDSETGYKFFRREKILPVLNEIEDTRWFWDTEVMVRSYLRGYKIAEIPCLFQRRPDKVSTVNSLRDTWDYFIKLWRFRRVVRALRAHGGVPAPAKGVASE